MSETAKFTPGPWGYVPGNEHHGPYVVNEWGAGDICDCYTMSNPSSYTVRNGGDSKPINHQHDEAEANARLIAAAPDLLEVVKAFVVETIDYATLNKLGDAEQQHNVKWARAVIAKIEGRS